MILFPFLQVGAGDGLISICTPLSGEGEQANGALESMTVIELLLQFTSTTLSLLLAVSGITSMCRVGFKFGDLVPSLFKDPWLSFLISMP